MSVCPFFRLSVCQPRLGGNVIFSAPNWDIAPIFLCSDSPHKWASVNILSVCLSVMLQKTLLLMDVFILVFIILFIYLSVYLWYMVKYTKMDFIVKNDLFVLCCVVSFLKLIYDNNIAVLKLSIKEDILLSYFGFK